MSTWEANTILLHTESHPKGVSGCISAPASSVANIALDVYAIAPDSRADGNWSDKEIDALPNAFHAITATRTAGQPSETKQRYIGDHASCAATGPRCGSGLACCTPGDGGAANPPAAAETGLRPAVAGRRLTTTWLTRTTLEGVRMQPTPATDWEVTHQEKLNLFQIIHVTCCYRKPIKNRKILIQNLSDRVNPTSIDYFIL